MPEKDQLSRRRRAARDRKYRVAHRHERHLLKRRWQKTHPEARNTIKKRNYARGKTSTSKKREQYLSDEIQLILAKERSDRELAKLLGRSVQAIQVKRVRIKKRSASQQTNAA